MKQVFLRNGKVYVEDVNNPMLDEGMVLIKTLYSAISSGTELSNISDSKSKIFSKIYSNPSKILAYTKSFFNLGLLGSKKVLSESINKNIKTGYSISGIVIAIGGRVSGINIGDYVAAAGAGFANHAEYNVVPKNLVVKIPIGVELLDASVTTLATISLNAIRRANLVGGEFCVVYGVGILGLITVQILRAYGVRVAAVDINNENLILAKSFGAEISVIPDTKGLEQINFWTNNLGADKVIFAANTNDSLPLKQSFSLLRRNGDLVLLGKANLNIDRNDIYQKQLNVITSTSYGPGRYDESYEIDGIDYPHSYVRWTLKKNMSEILRLMDIGLLDVSKLITSVHEIENARSAFESLKSGKEKIVCLNYNNILDSNFSVNPKSEYKGYPEILNIGVIGASSFFKEVHHPNLLKLNSKFFLHTLVSRDSSNLKHTSENLGFQNYSTDAEEIFSNKEIHLIFITSNQGTHFKYVKRALETNKLFFVEKPLLITYNELDIIKSLQSSFTKSFTVGYNRRYSRHVEIIKSKLINRQAAPFIVYNMNISKKSTNNSIFKEGGRIIGEACHIVDLFLYLIDSDLSHFSFDKLGNFTGDDKDDNVTITFKFKDGSLAILNYFSVGSEFLEKENMTIHFDGKTIILNDFRELSSIDTDNKREILYSNFDKGHLKELDIIHDAFIQNIYPIKPETLFLTSEITLEISRNEKL
jgi:predicted dehydrogenase/threonine dehydrogenase-like Zn-dependent dehydrogenase